MCSPWNGGKMVIWDLVQWSQNVLGGFIHIYKTMIAFVSCVVCKCYVRQCSTSRNSFFTRLQNGLAYTYIIMWHVFIGLGVNYCIGMCVCRSTAIHNCLSSGSLFFATLRQNTKNLDHSNNSQLKWFIKEGILCFIHIMNIYDFTIMCCNTTVL